MAASHRIENAAAANLWPQRPRACRRARHVVEGALSTARSSLRGRLQAFGAVGCSGSVSPAGNSVSDRQDKNNSGKRHDRVTPSEQLEIFLLLPFGNFRLVARDFGVLDAQEIIDE